MLSNINVLELLFALKFSSCADEVFMQPLYETMPNHMKMNVDTHNYRCML